MKKIWIILSFCCLCILSWMGGTAANSANDKEFLVYIGTYASANNPGIFVYRFDYSTGALVLVDKTSGVANPSYLAIEPKQQYLYAVNEVAQFAGKPSGSVSAFSIDAKTGKLTFLNQQSSQGSGPCYVTVDQTGKWVLVANYSSGSVAILPVVEGGKLGPATAMDQHKGKSVNRARQAESHAHCIVVDPGNRFVFSADLGLDKILSYRLDTAQGKIPLNDPAFVATDPGSGPRHFTFHPNGKLAFSIQELKSTIISYTYDEAKGVLNPVQTVSALPEGFTGTSWAADIHVLPSGKFVYGSNRGHNSIVIFAIDESTGKLTLVGHELTQGKTPRNFCIDPTGSFLLAANQDTNTIVSFRIDPNTGKLTDAGQITKVNQPVCIKFLSQNQTTSGLKTDDHK